MGQQEILDFLKLHKRNWYSAREISNNLGISISTIARCLKILREERDVEFDIVQLKIIKQHLFINIEKIKRFISYNHLLVIKIRGNVRYFPPLYEYTR